MQLAIMLSHLSRKTSLYPTFCSYLALLHLMDLCTHEHHYSSMGCWI